MKVLIVPTTAILLSCDDVTLIPTGHSPQSQNADPTGRLRACITAQDFYPTEICTSQVRAGLPEPLLITYLKKPKIGARNKVTYETKAEETVLCVFLSVFVDHPGL